LNTHNINNRRATGERDYTAYPEIETRFQDDESETRFQNEKREAGGCWRRGGRQWISDI